MARLSAANIMSNIALTNGGLVVIGGVSYIATANAQGGMDLVESKRKPLNFDKATGNLQDDAGNVVGRVNFRSKMTSDAIPELGTANVTIVVSDAYAEGHELKVVKVANTNKKDTPDWAGGAQIGTRQEWAFYLERSEA